MIKIKDSLHILKNSEDTYSVIFTGTRRVKKFRVDNLVKDTLDVLSAPQENSALYSKLKNYAKEDVDSCVNSLERFGILRKYENIDTKNKYFKQITFIDELTESWDETLRLQDKIVNSKVSVFGIGGIGTWIANGLYQMGIGEIKIVDPDKVSENNINRQLFFNSGDVGRYKVDVIKERLPDAKIKTYKRMISKKESLDDIIRGSDFLVNCADQPSVSETTEIIDSYARKYDISYCVAGGYNMHLGMVGPIIIPGKTRSFEDFLTAQKEADPLKGMEVIKTIENPGNLGAVAGAVSNMQLMEIFKHIIGKGTHNYNRFAEIDFMDLGMEWRTF